MKHIILQITAILAAATIGGCAAGGLIASPSAHEQKTDAEFELRQYRQERVLVLVDQPAWAATSYNLRQSITASLHDDITSKTRLSERNLIEYGRLVEIRDAYGQGFWDLEPAEVGHILGADLVLAVSIIEYDMESLADIEYYEGSISASAKIVDVETGYNLWPGSDNGKIVRVGFEAEAGHRVEQRLSEAVSHCIVRYLYDCPGPEFRHPDELSGTGWDSW